MFKIGFIPQPTADAIDHADFLELESIRQSDRNYSGSDLTAAFSRVDDDDPELRSGTDSRYESIVDAAFAELRQRQLHSGNGNYRYPFKVSDDDQLLEYVPTKGESELYLYLLFATRMNMRDKRVHADIDGTLLFERVCCEVAKNYMGDRTHGTVFGTARRGAGNEIANFNNAVDDLCKQLKEGVRFHSHSGYPPEAQDGNLDVVVWKSFADERPGQLIGFGQCKTGTHWAKGVFDLAPVGFCAKWVFTQPTVPPSRLYFISARVPTRKWHEVSVDAGILFDRCRIIDYAPVMDTIRPDWVAWTEAVIEAEGYKPT